MSGLKRRIRRPRAADESRTDENALSEPVAAPVDASPEGGEPAAPSGLPAGAEPDEGGRRPTTRRRGGLRRRLRYLRRAREVMLRDLGGLVYEVRRRGQDDATDLVTAKVERLAAVDAELRELETDLGTIRHETVLREPGMGGTCPACGELHPSDASFCARCGSTLNAVATDPPPTAVSDQADGEDAPHHNGRQAGAPAAAEPVTAPAPDLPA